MPEPLTIGAALSAAGSGASLTNSVLEFLKKAKKEGQDPRIADLIARLQPEALSLSGQYIAQIQQLRQSLLNAGVDVTKTQAQLIRETGLIHVRQRYLITKFAARINAIESQLSRFLDDAVAVAHCCGEVEFVVDSFAAAEEVRTVIHRETDPGRSLGQIMDSLEDRAQTFRTALGDLK